MIPARSARRCSCAASDSAGWPNGMPSSADGTCAPSAEPDVAEAWAALAARSAFLISSQFALTSAADVAVTDAEHMRVPANQLRRQRVGHVVDGEAPVSGNPLGGDPGMEERLEHDIADFLAQRTHVASLDRLCRLVRLFKQVPQQGRMSLLPVPGTGDP